MNKKLEDLLILSTKNYSPQYGAKLASHLPMTLIALQRMGANDRTLQNANNKQIEKLEPIRKAKFKITTSNWQQYLGTYQYFADYQLFFTTEFTNLGIIPLLKTYLALLIPGVGAGAFHALIRLAYALTLLNEANEIASAEIIISLAYWADSFLNLGKLPPSSKNHTNPINSLKHILKQNYTFPKIIKGNIFQRMQFVQQHTQFNNQLKPLNITENTLGSIANLLLIAPSY